MTTHRPHSPALLLATAILTLGLAAPGQAQAGTIWIPIENWSGHEYVYDIRISSEYADTRGANELGRDTLWPADYIEIPVPIHDTCYHDIRIKTDMWIHDFWGVDLCETAAIVIVNGDAWIEYFDYEDGWYGH